MGQIIINEFRRATGDITGNEYVELLLTEDLTATELQSYFIGDSTAATLAKYSAYQFTNMASIAPVFKAGTIIAIGGSPANQEILYNPTPSGTNNDWNIRLTPTAGFLTKLLPAGNFDSDFAASDIVYVDNTTPLTTTNTVDSIAWPTTGLGAFGSAAKVQIPAPNNGNSGIVEFSSALGGVNKTANYAVNNPGSIGLPNGGINTIYINSLRNREANGAPTLDNPNVNPPFQINEDITNAANTGFSFAGYLGEFGGDGNNDPLGVAVTGVDNTNGNWQFLTNGNTWTNFGTVSENSATVLGPTRLYNGLVGNTPNAQNWLSLTNLNLVTPGIAGSEIFSGNGANLNSTAANSIYAGYTKNPLNSSFPVLDRTSGFSLSFNLQIISESRANQNRAGFSIVAVTSDRKSIEIGFQQLSPTSGNIFAQGDGITPNPGGQTNSLFVAAENIAYNTNIATNYTLRVQGDNYFLSDGSSIILSGPLRNYSAFSGAIDPYETPNFLFLGDDTTSAQANINLTRVSLQTPPKVRFVPNPNFYSTPGNEPKITFRAWDGSNGVASGTTGVNAAVTGGTTPFSTNAIARPIAVIPVNDAPSFVKGPDRTLNRNSGLKTVPGWATAIVPGPANESAQTINFQVVGNDNTGLFSVLPAIDSLGQLTFTPATGAIGSATISLNLKDNGGIANGGVDTSANQTFAINVNNTSTFNFSAANYSVNENGTSATIAVTRTDAANVAADVSYSISNGSANAGSDYTATSGTLNFAIGETTKTFTIPIVDDTLVEGNETVNIRLISPTNGAELGTISTAVLTIVDTTPIPTPIPIPTPTPIPTPIPSPIPTPTSIPTTIPTPIPTTIPTPTPTTISIPTPTTISIPTPTAISIPTPTTISIPTPTTISIPTPTTISIPTPTAIPTPIPTTISIPTPTAIPTPIPTTISIPTPTTISIPTPTAISIPTPTAISIPTPTAISIPTPIPTTISIPTPTTISIPTPIPTPISTPAETPTPTPAPSQIAIAIPFPTPSITPTPSPIFYPIEDCICDRTITPDRTSIPTPNITQQTFNGTDGKDTLTGSNLNDSINGFNGSDLLIGLEGSDNIYGGFPSSISVGADIDSDTIFGNENNDYIIGHAGNDIIYAGKDHDLTIAGKDNDLIWGDKGNDTVFGDDGNDTLFGGTSDSSDGDLTGRDLLFGDRGNDILYGQEGEDTVSGGEDNDTLHGGKDNDLIFGDSGDDLLFGDLGNDTICAGDDDDTIFGDIDKIVADISSQKDYLCGDSGNDLIFGNDDTDKLCGGDGNDTLYGGKDDDTLIGGIGDDWLIGDLGNDTLQGGVGRDYFMLTLGEGSDVITDFTKGEDLLVLTGGLKFDRLTIIPENNSTLIKIANTGQIMATLSGVSVSAIGPQDFRVIDGIGGL